MLINTSSATANERIINGGFEDGLNGWNSDSWSQSSTKAQSGNYSAYRGLELREWGTISQNIDLTDVDIVTWCSAGGGNDISAYMYLNEVLISSIPDSMLVGAWTCANPDVSSYNGEYTLSIKRYTHPQACCEYGYIDSISAISSTSILSGYINNTGGNPIFAATITLNASGGSTTSNETGYYAISGISDGTYLITATSPTHEDYTDTVSITSDTEKNITMTLLTPTLSNVRSIDTTINYIWLGWNENTVVDSVKIFRDTDTNLLGTKNTAGVDTSSYQDTGLNCGTEYSYWLQPMDGAVEGAKTRLDESTVACVPTETPTPVEDKGRGSVAPKPTVKVDFINMTVEEQELYNLSLLDNKPLFQNPYFSVSWEEVWRWMLLLLIILCAYISLDSITEQRWSKFTGLIALIPGAYFAYLSGYLII